MERTSFGCRLWRLLRQIGVVALLLALANAASADTRTDFLVRMLGTSSQFRVRAQAALALGSRPKEASVLTALSNGLRDEHPAVRAASASALEQLSDAVAMPWLEKARQDRDPSVRSAVAKAIQSLRAGRDRLPSVANTIPTPPTDGASYYVAVGVPSAKALKLGDVLAKDLRTHVTTQVLQIAGVRIAPAEESTAEAQRVVAQRRLAGYHLESAVTSLEERSDGSIRAQVSVVVATYPGRDIRAMLTGAATIVGGGQGNSDKLEVISAAFTGALRRLPQAMQAGLARAP
ncbi:MAG: hypothetical protein RL385_2673 [Pseudomonadota bacterium]|jgi:HEAT repeat protein